MSKTAAPLDPDGAEMTFTGRVLYLRLRRTKQNRDWATAVLSTEVGRVRLSVFPLAYDALGPLTPGQNITVTGRVDRRGKRPPRLVVLVALPTA